MSTTTPPTGPDQPEATSPYTTPPGGSAPPAPAPTPYDSAPYASGPHAPGPYGRPPAAGTDGMAITSLVTGILGTGLIAIGFGIAGLVRTKRSGRSGRGLAVAGIVLGSLGIVAWMVVIGLVVAAVNNDDFRESFEEGFTEASGMSMTVGQCFEPPADLADVQDITDQDCAGEHAAEVVGTQEMTDPEFPGQTVVDATAQEFCYDVFADYVGVGYDSSELEMGYFFPTETSWTFGDRQLACWVVTVDGAPLTGSVAGSAR